MTATKRQFEKDWYLRVGEGATQKRNVTRSSSDNERVFIYFVGPKDGPVKIGKAKNVRYRLSGLQTGSPVELELLGVMIGRPNLERALHSRFERYRKHGEWFEKSQEIIEFIENHTIACEAAYFKRLNPDEEVAALKASLKERHDEMLRRLKMSSKERNEIARREVLLRMKDKLAQQIAETWDEQIAIMHFVLECINEVNDDLAKKTGMRIKDNRTDDAMRTALRRLVNADWRQAARILFDLDFKDQSHRRDCLKRLANDWLKQNEPALTSDCSPGIQI